jgi:hypothetical protein
MVRGFTVSWSLLISALVGVWLMISPSLFGMSNVVSDNNEALGALVVAVSIITMAEVVRKFRFLILLFGLWIIAFPWIIFGNIYNIVWNNLIAGAFLILLSIPRGKILNHYGSWKP